MDAAAVQDEIGTASSWTSNMDDPFSSSTEISRDSNHVIHILSLILLSSDANVEESWIINVLRALEERRGPPPASKKAIESLAVGPLLFSDIPKNVDDIDSKSESLLCVVCQEHLPFGEDCVHMPCKHVFHVACAHSWLNVRNTCPICRFAVEGSQEARDDDQMSSAVLLRRVLRLTATLQRMQQLRQHHERDAAVSSTPQNSEPAGTTQTSNVDDDLFSPLERQPLNRSPLWASSDSYSLLTTMDLSQTPLMPMSPLHRVSSPLPFQQLALHGSFGDASSTNQMPFSSTPSKAPSPGFSPRYSPVNASRDSPFEWRRSTVATFTPASVGAVRDSSSSTRPALSSSLPAPLPSSSPPGIPDSRGGGFLGAVSRGWTSLRRLAHAVRRPARGSSSSSSPFQWPFSHHQNAHLPSETTPNSQCIT